MAAPLSARRPGKIGFKFAARPLRVDFPTRVYYVGYPGIASRPRGASMHEIAKQALTTRLARVEGQVHGLLRMIEEERPCIEVLARCAAVRSALRKVELIILRDQFGHSVAAAFASGDVLGERRKVEELVETIGRITR